MICTISLEAPLLWAGAEAGIKPRQISNYSTPPSSSKYYSAIRVSKAG